MNNRSIGIICLCLFLIGYGINTITNIELAPLVLALLAVIAGVLILFGR